MIRRKDVTLVPPYLENYSAANAVPMICDDPHNRLANAISIELLAVYWYRGEPEDEQKGKQKNSY